MTEKSRADQISKEVVAILGGGWKGRVWENLGWHVAWENGAVCLHYDERSNKFWAMVGDIGSGTGNAELTPSATYHYTDPLKAVTKAIEYAQEEDIKRRQIMLSCAGVLLKLGKS